MVLAALAFVSGCQQSSRDLAESNSHSVDVYVRERADDEGEIENPSSMVEHFDADASWDVLNANLRAASSDKAHESDGTAPKIGWEAIPGTGKKCLDALVGGVGVGDNGLPRDYRDVAWEKAECAWRAEARMTELVLVTAHANDGDENATYQALERWKQRVLDDEQQWRAWARSHCRLIAASGGAYSDEDGMIPSYSASPAVVEDCRLRRAVDRIDSLTSAIVGS